MSGFDFSSLAEHYDDWYETSLGQRHDRVQKADVLKLLPHPGNGLSLLDVGCGTGHWSRFFASLGYTVHGIDISAKMISRARSKQRDCPGCTFSVADAQALPFADASFAVVAAITSLEFMPDPAAALREMARCTQPGGIILVGVLNRAAPLNQARLAQGKEPYTSAHMFTAEELEDLLAPFGEVRMRASLVPSPDGLPTGDKKGRQVLSNCLSRLRLGSGRLRGPLLVARARKCENGGSEKTK
ncbi:MAG: methyltransferase domain-containing protein [Thermoleophilia bacterium]|nr:methyltransferase domain-containing protein [Thermoleophilia bacterium]